MKHGIYYAYWEDMWGAEYIPYIEKVAKLGFALVGLRKERGIVFRTDNLITYLNNKIPFNDVKQIMTLENTGRMRHWRTVSRPIDIEYSSPSKRIENILHGISNFFTVLFYG